MSKRSTHPLSVTHPELAKEALFDASTVVAGTHKKLPWRCGQGHEWEAQVKSRALLGRGCPYCANKIAMPGVNDLATTHPKLAAEALFDPTAVTFGSHRKMPWRCTEGHEWEAAVASRAAGAGCPVCAGKMVWPGLNDLATLHPDVAAEALFDPSTVTASSSRKMPWRCTQGHEWEAVVSNRTVQGQGCPYCANRAVLPGFNDLATTHPEIANEALFDPTSVTYGSNKPGRWRCNKGHEWEAPIAGRTSGGEGCSVCAGKTVVPGVNDLATTHPVLAREALFDPTRVTAGSHKKFPWRCEQGHEWEAQVKSRALSGQGCPICGNKRVLPGFNDLATTHPQLVKEALFDPTSVTYGTGQHLPWRCDKGHEWKTTPIRRVVRGDGCPVCGNKKVLPGFNDLATTHPELAKQALFDPTRVTAGSHKKFPWRCPEGHEWKAQVKSRALSEQGCPSCAATGYDPAKSGYVYLMRHREWAMLQIGISNVIASRMRTHTHRGWELLDVRGPMPGDAARALEVALLRLLTESGVRLVPSSSSAIPERRMPEDARSVGEAWWESDFPAQNLSALIEALRDREWE